MIPDSHLLDIDTMFPIPFHRGQELCHNSTRRITAMLAGTQGGKALALDTPIPTPGGFVTMDDLRVGDCVFDERGKPCNVVFVTSVQLNRQCYRVTFDDGSQIVADAEHRWLTQTYNQRKNQARRTKEPGIDFVSSRPQCQPAPDCSVVTTKDIMNTLRSQSGARNHSIDLSLSVQYTTKNLPVPPYTFGAWLGDGKSSGAVIFSADAQIVDEIKLEGVPISDGKKAVSQGKALTYYLGVRKKDRQRNSKGQYIVEDGIYASLRGLGVLDNKHIPELYKTSSAEQRLALLQGLMDTDGYCKPNGRAEFTTISKRLALDTVELMRSLGLKPRLSTGRATLYGQDKGPKYRVFVTTKQPIFRLQRKLSRQVGGYRPDIFRRYVDSVELVQSVPVKCIQVDSPSHMYLAGRDYIPTHNTSYGPIWLAQEIERLGGGDWLAVTSTFDLFKLKMLPAMRAVFEGYLGIGRYWAQARIIELADPNTGEFKAKRADDLMWGRIILRSADAVSGLESATAKGALLDEAGQDRFTLDAYRAIRRRLALNRGRILITTTLYNLGWLVNEVIDKAEANGVKSVEHFGDAELEHTDSEDADICLVQFDSIVNPAYPIEEYRQAESDLPDDEFQMFYRGRKAALRYLIYDALDRTRHTCPRFPIPDNWKRYLGLDFGGANTAGMFYAEEPGTERLYAYREYKAGKRTAEDHADELLRDEPGIPQCVGGSKSEGQWRLEFANGGLPIMPPMIKDVNLGINRVYRQHKRDGIIYFEDLVGILDEKGRYQRKRDRQGEVTSEIKDKNSFHFLDAERYIIGYIRPPENKGLQTSETARPLTRQSRWGGARSSVSSRRRSR